MSQQDQELILSMDKIMTGANCHSVGSSMSIYAVICRKGTDAQAAACEQAVRQFIAGCRKGDGDIKQLDLAMDNIWAEWRFSKDDQFSRAMKGVKK